MSGCYNDEDKGRRGSHSREEYKEKKEKTKMEDGREILVAKVEDEEVSGSRQDQLCWRR